MDQVRLQNAMMDTILDIYSRVAFKEIDFPEENLKWKINRHIKKLSSTRNIGKKEIINTLIQHISNSNMLLQSLFSEIEEEEEQQQSIPKEETEYRYKVSDLVKIYKQFVGGSANRNTFNNYTLPDSGGNTILASVHLPNEHKSICESDIIEFFLVKYHTLLEPAKIRKYHYRAPKKQRGD